MSLKKGTRAAILATICLATALVTFVPAYSAPSADGHWKTVAEFPVGFGPGKIAYSIGFGEPEGPDSFAVDQDGVVYVLDGLDRSIEVSRDGKYERTIDLPFALDLTDLVIDMAGDLHVLDLGHQPAAVYRLTPQGELLDSVFFDQHNDHPIRGLSADQDGKVYLLIGGRAQLAVDEVGRGRFTPHPGQTPLKGRSPLLLSGRPGAGQVEAEDSSWTISFQGKHGGIIPLGEDSAGNLHVEVVDLVAGQRAAGEITVRKYDQQGQMVGVVPLPAPIGEYVPKTRITGMGNNDKVYALLPGRTTVQIVEAVYGKGYQSQFSRLQAEAERETAQLLAASDTGDASIMAWGPAISESTAKSRALAMVNLTWSYDNTRNKTPSTSTLTPPDWLGNASSGSKTGIPYNWGGFDGIDKSSNPAGWTNFKDAMTKNKYAGNVNDTTCCYQPDTAGIDCSGMVSAAWNLNSKVGTYAIRDDRTLTSIIDTSKQTMYPMDAIVNASHVLLFNNGDQVAAYSLEATTTGDDKAKSSVRSWSWIASQGMVYRKYVNLTH